MATYVYLPFATAEARSIADSWNYGRGKKQKTAYEVIERPNGLTPALLRRLSIRVLSRVSSNDKLYILSHAGSVTRGLNQPAVQIGMDVGATEKSKWPPVWEGGVWKGFTPEKLAAHLEAEGLTKSIADVRLFACGTGIPHSTKIPAFAKRLKTELLKRGYKQVMVSGYLGESTANYNFRKYVPNTGSTQNASPNMLEYTADQHKGVKDDSGDLVPASTRRVTF